MSNVPENAGSIPPQKPDSEGQLYSEEMDVCIKLLDIFIQTLKDPTRRDISATALKELRMAWKVSIDTAADAIGVDPRTWKRWEAGETQPVIAQARLWQWLFSSKPTRVLRVNNDRMQKDSKLVGTFDYTAIRARITLSDAVWVIRARSMFRFAEDSRRAGELAEVLKDNPSFKYHCVWTKDDPTAKESNQPQVRPVSVAKETFEENFYSIAPRLAEIGVNLNRIKGYEIDAGTAAKLGLSSNSPTATMIIEYRDHPHNFGQPLDVFLECPVAFYDPTTLIRVAGGDDPRRWIQLDPRNGKDYFKGVWEVEKTLKTVKRWRPSLEILSKAKIPLSAFADEEPSEPTAQAGEFAI